MENYVVLSLETHLFFARIMKEHALFLMAGFPCKEEAWIQKADWYREQFENLLRDVVALSDKRVNQPILCSGELVTEFTIPAEERTEKLSGVAIATQISRMTERLCPRSEGEHMQMRGRGCPCSRALFGQVRRVNEQALRLVSGLITFKEALLKEFRTGKIYNANYPLLIEHIIREAGLYRDTIWSLQQNRPVSYESLLGTENFWNRIMMEHALFIRGLLDPSEEQLILTADNFAADYRKLLEMAECQDAAATEALAAQSLDETQRYAEFKATGAEGILECRIASIILPLLADHVLREANHYIRILKCGNADGRA